MSEKNTIIPADSLEQNESICLFKRPNPSTSKNIKGILFCVFFIMSAILKRKRAHAKSLVSALCENKAGALLANQNTRLQYKISANQGVVE